MQTLDIFLKLVPFTVKNPKTGEVFFTFFLDDFSIADMIITGIEVTLIFIFLITMIKLWFSYRKDKKDIGLLSTEIINLKENGFSYYSDFLEKVSINSKIKHLWNEFDESLIKKDGEVENSLDSAYFFNEHSLASDVGSKFYSAIPGILLGIGLLGTFLSLYVALAQLNLGGEDTGVMKSSIIHFVEMVGVKFTASVWGVFLSVAFTLYEKGLESKLSTKIKALQDNIDEIFKRQTAEQNLSQILTQSKQQTQALNSLAETLIQRIGEQFNPMIAQMNSHLEYMPQQISKAIGESLKEPLEALQNNASSAAETQSESLGVIVQSFVEKLEQTTGEQANNVQKMMEETSENLKGLISNIQQISQEQNSKIIQERETIGEQSNQITKEMNKLLSKLSLETANRDLKVEELMTMISSQHSTLFETNKAFVEQMEESVLNIMNTIVSRVKDVEVIIDTSAKKVSIVPTMLNSLEHSSNNLQNFSDKTENATKYLSETITTLANIENSITKHLESIQNTTQSMNEISYNTKSILEDSKETVKELHSIYSDIITENEKNLTDLGDAMSHWLAQYDKQTRATMQSSLSDVQDALSRFANTLTSSIATLEDAIDSINEKIQR